MKKGDQILVRAYTDIFDSAELRVVPLGRQVLFHAAKLRAKMPSLRTPDALHAATAIASSCGAFLTNDTGFKKISGLGVIILSDSIE